MSYRVHSKRAQLSLFTDDELPKTIDKPDSTRNEPNHKAFRRMVLRAWNIKSKSKSKT